MEDAARIRKTIRNCTAVLIAAIGVATLALDGQGEIGMVMAGGAVLYLTPTVLVALGQRMDELGLYESPKESGDSDSMDT